ISRSNTDSPGETNANRVAQDLSFLTSGEPKISTAERPSTPRTASVHSLKRGPRTGWARYALASAMLLIEYRLDISLVQSPVNVGKMYHIQHDCFPPPPPGLPGPLPVVTACLLGVTRLRLHEPVQVVRVRSPSRFGCVCHQPTSCRRTLELHCACAIDDEQSRLGYDSHSVAP